MANTISALAPLLFSAAREVPRELTGLIAAVSTNFDSKGVAKGDTVTVAVSPSQAQADVTAAQTFTAGTDRTAASRVLTLSKFKGTSWNLTAEQEVSLFNGGVNAAEFFKQTLIQGFRVLINGMETYLGTTIRANASRANGTAATTPFGTNINVIADAGQILTDNGTSMLDRQLVLNTAAGTKLRQIANLYKANEAGSAELLRQGILGDLFGFKIRESAGIAVAVTAGTGANYVVNNVAGYAIGATSIAVDIGTGTVLAGDVVTFAGDSNKYVVATGITAAGTLVLQEPGLLAAHADEDAMTVGSAATANLAFTRQSTVLVARPALQPQSPVADQMVITDPQTGLSFLLVHAVGDAMASWYLRVVYDAFCPNQFAIDQLLG